MMFLPQFFLFIFGLIFGSFITALSYRYPRKISNLGGRSFCDNCKKQIGWRDNIPLLSYILLGGKCRDCKTKISLRYPIIELATGIGFLLIGFHVLPLILFTLLEIIFIIDLENQVIPDNFIFTGILVSLIINYQSPFTGLLAGFACAIFLLLIFLFTKGRGMGLGDVKFAVLGGMIVGLPLSPIWLFVAFLTGAIVGTILIIGKKAGLKSKIAFGPFLVASIPITLLWGQKIIDIILLR
jgi:prepilin signal peptidase PulO-like enzyme (type II secretory pathway)